LRLQHFPHRAVLEINDNGSLGEAFAPAPVIGRDRTQRFGFTMLANRLFNCRRTALQLMGIPKPASNLFVDPGAGGMAEKPHEFANSARFPRANGGATARFSTNVFRAD
jgi:hypothetical protein